LDYDISSILNFFKIRFPSNDFDLSDKKIPFEKESEEE